MQADGLPLVSVATPVYNGEKYLAECIESVLAQTYQNWEYVVVNNCSTDRTMEIAQVYARKETRIRIHNNQEFVSALQNHNTAFRQISPASKYCKVVHADDWLFPDCISQMVKVAGLPYPSTVVPGREICRSTLLRRQYVFGSPTSVLFRSDLIRDRKTF